MITIGLVHQHFYTTKEIQYFEKTLAILKLLLPVPPPSQDFGTWNAQGSRNNYFNIESSWSHFFFQTDCLRINSHRMTMNPIRTT